jgi:2'-deoxynucleoside 5'-phosphate N-hydrolase
MKSKAFISYSYANKVEFKLFDTKLRDFLAQELQIDSYSFVFDYKGNPDYKSLMDAALKKIDDSDLLIAELSYKSIGIGIEVGYAKARNKKIIYIHKKGTEVSTTVSGVSDIRIEYEDIEDLITKLKKAINRK